MLVVPDEERCQFTVPFTLESLANHVNATKSRDSDNFDGDESFGVAVDRGLLVDSCGVELGEVIGEGTLSMVYSGLYKSKPVAVKVIQPDEDASVSPEHKVQFQREVRMLSGVKHQNIVEFIGVTLEPIMTIITELMKGGTLRRYLWNSRPGCLDLKLALRFALDISRAMEYLHAKGIIHRDLKPCNLLLTEDKKHIKLADFGVAREEVMDEMTCEAGTYRWMAPEIFNLEPAPVGAKRHYDHKVDVYSFAMVFWELLTNQTPFRGRSSIMAAYATAKKIRPSLENLPQKLVPLLESCWAADPSERPEFKDITIFLTGVLQSLSPLEVEEEDNEATRGSIGSWAEEKDSSRRKRSFIGSGKIQPEESDRRPKRDSERKQPEEKRKKPKRESIGFGLKQLEVKGKKCTSGIDFFSCFRGCLSR